MICSFVAVYLRADPEKCYERLRKRDRKEETGVPVVSIGEKTTQCKLCKRKKNNVDSLARAIVKFVRITTELSF